MSDASIWSPAADTELVAAIGALLRGTSTSTVSVIDFGTRTFTTQTGLYFRAGDWLIITKQTDQDVWMAGSVVSYSITTGVLVFAPEVSSGSGSHSLWNISLSGVWVPIQWDGGTVTTPAIFQGTVTCEDAVILEDIVTVNGAMNFAKTPTSTAGSFGLSTRLTLADASVVLTPVQIFNNTLLISPTAARVLTLPPATDLFIFLVGHEIGSYFDFTIVNDTAHSVTLAGNSGIVQAGLTQFAEGSSSFRVTVDSLTIISVTNIGSPVPKVGAGDIDTSAVQSGSADILLAANSPRLQSINMTTEGNSVILPAATGLIVSSPTFVILNDGFYPIGIKDNDGNLLRVIDAGGNATLSLVTNTTIAGGWMIAGEKLKSGFITFNAVLANTYTYTTYDIAVKMTDTLSVHFAKIIANGLACFVADTENKVIGTPVSLSATANMQPCAAFRITDTTCMVFYAVVASNSITAVVISLAGTVVTVGTPAVYAVATSSVEVENGVGAPKIAQLDTNLFILAYAITNHYAVGIQVSGGTTVTFGTPTVLVGSSTSQSESQVVFKLTATTALILHKTNTVSPYQGKAVVATVTNANPPVVTLGTAINTMTSNSNANAQSAVMMSPVVCAVVDNNNVSQNATIQFLEVTGTVIVASATTVLDTTAGNNIEYSASHASRFLPHVYRLSDTSVLWWNIATTGGSKAIAVSCVFPTITLGNLVKNSFSTTLTNNAGAGRMLGISETNFIAGMVEASDEGGITLITHKISGLIITPGKTLRLNHMHQGTQDVDGFIGAKLAEGIYAINSYQSTLPLAGSSGLRLVETNGVAIIDNGTVEEYTSSYRNLLNVIDSRIVTVQADQGLVGANTVSLLRLTNIDIVT